jgi:hypothetical protein
MGDSKAIMARIGSSDVIASGERSVSMTSMRKAKGFQIIEDPEKYLMRASRRRALCRISRFQSSDAHEIERSVFRGWMHDRGEPRSGFG